MRRMTATSAPAAPSALTDADRAEAGRKAIADCPEAFEELRGEGDEQLVEFAARDDLKVLAALDTIGDLSEADLPLLGKYLAEQLVEDAIDAEAAKQLGSYRAARAPQITVDPLAYEANDPKHPDYLERILAAA
jgi:hypothetical protein